MKKVILIFAASIMLAGFTTKTMAQTSASITNAGASANVLAVMTLTQTTPLNFGSMDAPTAVATVIISTTGVRSSTGTITLLGSTPPYSQGVFTVTGTGTANYAITLPSSAITISNGTQTMSVDGFNFLTTNGSVTTNPCHLVAGADGFGVGATLHVTASQHTGAYTGVYTVSVDYM